MTCERQSNRKMGKPTPPVLHFHARQGTGFMQVAAEGDPRPRACKSSTTNRTLSLEPQTFTGSRNGTVYRIFRLSGPLQHQHGRGFGGRPRTRFRSTDPRSGRMGRKSNLLDGLANWNRRLLPGLLHFVRGPVRLETCISAIGVHLTAHLLPLKLHTQLPSRAVSISRKI